MKKWTNVVAIALAMVLVSFVVTKAADAPAKPLHGKVTKVADDGSSITITPHAKKGETATDVVVKITKDTKISKDGVDVKPADLLNAAVAVTLNADGSAAATIEVHAGKKKPATASK